MDETFYCIECGENEVDVQEEMCDDCMMADFDEEDGAI